MEMGTSVSVGPNPPANPEEGDRGGTLGRRWSVVCLLHRC